jgi:hypothetical protein
LTLLGRKEKDREQSFLLCEILPLYDKTQRKKEKSATQPKDFFGGKNGTKLHCQNIAGFFKL